MLHRVSIVVVLALACPGPAAAQVPPSAAARAAYAGLHAAAANNDAAAIASGLAAGAAIDARDGHGRTPTMVATHLGADAALTALIAAGADLDLQDRDRYDVLTIAGVADNRSALALALALAAGADASAITSIYDGTALIAAAHLGHAEIVAALIDAGAPLDHVNNLGWTALIEAIVLGDGGPRHQATLAALIAGGADVNLPDGSGRLPLALAEARGFDAMAQMLDVAGARRQ